MPSLDSRNKHEDSENCGQRLVGLQANPFVECQNRKNCDKRNCTVNDKMRALCGHMFEVLNPEGIKSIFVIKVELDSKNNRVNCDKYNNRCE